MGQERLSYTDDEKSPKYRNYPVIKYGCQWSEHGNKEDAKPNSRLHEEVERERFFYLIGVVTQSGNERAVRKTSHTRVGHYVFNNGLTLLRNENNISLLVLAYIRDGIDVRQRNNRKEGRESI